MARLQKGKNMYSYALIDLCISEQDKFHGDLELDLREVKQSKN